MGTKAHPFLVSGLSKRHRFVINLIVPEILSSYFTSFIALTTLSPHMKTRQYLWLSVLTVHCLQFSNDRALSAQLLYRDATEPRALR